MGTCLEQPSQHDANKDQNEEILTLAQGGAESAAWTLDRGLARDVIRSVMAMRSVSTARITDENDVVLAEAVRNFLRS